MFSEIKIFSILTIFNETPVGEIGKTTVIVNTMINQNRNNYLKSVEGFGSKRVFGV